MSLFSNHRNLLVSALLLWTNHAGADTFFVPDSVQLHGFLSQAFIKTSANNFFGTSSDDNGSFDFRELGINGSWRVLPKLQLSIQLLSRDAGGNDNNNIRLDYGFADYMILSDDDNLIGMRAGRITNPLGFYNDTRDVAFIRPSILLPQSIYFDRTRNLALSADGVQIYGEHRADSGDWFFQTNIALPRLGDPDIEASLLGQEFPGELDARLSVLGRVVYESRDGQLRLGLSGGVINIHYDAMPPQDPLTSGDILFTPLIFSAQYNAENWSLTGEYAQRHIENEHIFTNFGLPKIKITGESFYLQGAYRINPNWESFIRYDVLYSDHNDRNGSQAATATRPAYSRFAKDWTVGLRWDVTPSFMLRSEFHAVDGTAWLPLQDNPVANDTERYWTLFTILGSYRF